MRAYLCRQVWGALWDKVGKRQSDSYFLYQDPERYLNSQEGGFLCDNVF